MGRASKQEERGAQILDAYERCIVRYGIEGSTLQRIADEAELARPLVRHNVGNLADLREAMIERYLARSEAHIAALVQSLSDAQPATDLIAVLFAAENPSQSHDSLLAGALIAAGRSDDALDEAMNRWVEGFNDTVVAVLKRQHPKAPKADLYIVGVGIVGVFFNTDSLSPALKAGPMGTAARRAAERLLASLVG